MFTGIIEQLGRVEAIRIDDDVARLSIASTWEDLVVGESIAVNGVCLTLVPRQTQFLEFDLSPETLRLTTLGKLTSGSLVNLERAMQAHSRFGGHYVSGHVDTTAAVQSLQLMGDYLEVELTDLPADAARYVLPKGSITVEGVSLTINSIANNSIQLMLVPHTLAHTTLQLLEVGQRVNIEFDYFARIIAHQLQLREQTLEKVAL